MVSITLVQSQATAQLLCLKYSAVFQTERVCEILTAACSCTGKMGLCHPVSVTFSLFPPGVALRLGFDPPRSPAVPRCPDGWVGYLGKCYYFSEAEGNWTFSQSNCSSFGASLQDLVRRKTDPFWGPPTLSASQDSTPYPTRPAPCPLTALTPSTTTPTDPRNCHAYPTTTPFPIP
uniref:C-type lectin domain-containing protein n=1 Tax=Chrysemys picta bellii TaxID=8478 RepID=A0A8C3FAL5_CHRPI